MSFSSCQGRISTGRGKRDQEGTETTRRQRGDSSAGSACLSSTKTSASFHLSLPSLPSLPSLGGSGNRVAGALGSWRSRRHVHALCAGLKMCHVADVPCVFGVGCLVSARGDGERGVGRYSWTLKILVEIFAGLPVLHSVMASCKLERALLTPPFMRNHYLLEAIWLSISHLGVSCPQTACHF